MSLEDFIGYTEETPPQREKVLLVDTNNMSMRCLYATPYDPTDTDFTSYKTAFMMSLKKAIKQFHPTKIIFCQEGGNNWRKQEYDGYKASRAEGYSASLVDFDAFFKMNNEFINGLQKTLQNALFLRIPRLEADDLIALITKYKQDWDILLISTDHDFYQLHKFENFEQYDPVKHKFIEVLNPELALMQKIITGDASDDIPKLKDRVGPKTVEKILLEGLDEWLDENDLHAAFDRNRKIIDFEYIPKEFHQPVIDAVDSWKQGKFNGNEYYTFVIKQQIPRELEKLDESLEIFSRVKSTEKEKDGSETQKNLS